MKAQTEALVLQLLAEGVPISQVPREMNYRYNLSVKEDQVRTIFLRNERLLDEAYRKHRKEIIEKGYQTKKERIDAIERRAKVLEESLKAFEEKGGGRVNIQTVKDYLRVYDRWASSLQQIQAEQEASKGLQIGMKVVDDAIKGIIELVKSQNPKL